MNVLGADNVVRAFSEEHVERLTGLTRAQLRYWDRTGFFSPAYADDGRGKAYSRVYSFRDVVGLKTLGILRNKYKVSLQHLRQVAECLSHLKDDLWTKTTLYVLNRRVVFHEEGTGRLQDAVSGQYVIGIPLKTVISDVAKASDKLLQRPKARIGKVERNRNVVQNAWVVSGTRIPTAAIRRFHEAGYSTADILKEYPTLTEKDVRAALAHEERSTAAA